MTCPHIRFSIINKAKGNSLIASAAYNARQNIYDEQQHRMNYSHTKSDDHKDTFMLLPDGAPKSYLDVSRIWNDLNIIEQKKIAYKIIIPFQRELSFEKNIELTKELLNKMYVKNGHPIQVSIHTGKNGNDHIHAIVADRRLVNGTWEPAKTMTAYYRRGTVKELNKNGKVINPDAELLTEDDKIDTPKLKNKKLQYDKNGNIIFTKGWQELQYDNNGAPLQDKDGFPVMKDIREPDYEPGTKIQKSSKNGNYTKLQWKKTTIKHSDISNYNNIKKLRHEWQKLQNKYFKDNGIKNEYGEPLMVDLRSYSKQNEERPHDEQLTPTRHVFRTKNDKSLDAILEGLVQYNENAKKQNERVKTIQAEKYKKLKAQKELELINKGIDKEDADNIKFFNACNSRKTFISEYEKYHNDMLRRKKHFLTAFEKHIENNLRINDNAAADNDNRTERGKAKETYLHRHKFALYSLQRKLSKMMPSILNVRQKAAEIFDAWNNEEIASYMGKRFGENVIPIAANVLERTRPDHSNPFDAKIEKSPYYPDIYTNTKCLQAACEKITGNPDFNKMQKQAFAEWDKKEGQTAPATVHDMMSVYLTAEGFYDAKLNDETWETMLFEQNRNEAENINQQYKADLDKITQKEKQETLRKAEESKQQTTIALEEHKAIHTRMSEEKDALLEKIIIIANTYSDIDINSMVYQKGKNAGNPYRSKQLNYIRNLAASNRIPKKTGIHDMLASWDKMKDEADIYFHRFIKCDYDDWIKTQSQKQPVDLSPANSSNQGKSRTLT